jgi:hypothetical protein
MRPKTVAGLDLDEEKFSLTHEETTPIKATIDVKSL